METERVDKFYLSHLNYGGRGNINRKDDAMFRTTRDAMDLVFDTAWRHVEAGRSREFVTGNNDADGAWLLHWVRRRFPEREAPLRAKLAQWGGNSSGVNVANIDNLGNVHPDTFWWDYTLGNVRQRPFSAIWRDAVRSAAGGDAGDAARGPWPLRRMRVLRRLRRQHARARVAADRRSMGGGSRLLSRRRGTRHRARLRTRASAAVRADPARRRSAVLGCR